MNKKPPYLRNSPPSSFEIAAYWEAKEPRFVEFITEPRCFACHWYPFGEGHPKNLQKAWKKRLQRSHIIAASIAGSFEPENFLLLCARCHHEAPMTNDRELVLKWARAHESYMHIIYLEIESAMQEVGLEKLVQQHPCVPPPEQFIRYARLAHLDFHPHATRAEKIRGIALLFRHYLETGAYLEKLPLFTGVVQ